MKLHVNSPRRGIPFRKTASVPSPDGTNGFWKKCNALLAQVPPKPERLMDITDEQCEMLETLRACARRVVENRRENIPRRRNVPSPLSKLSVAVDAAEELSLFTTEQKTQSLEWRSRHFNLFQHTATYLEELMLSDRIVDTYFPILDRKACADASQFLTAARALFTQYIEVSHTWTETHVLYNPVLSKVAQSLRPNPDK